MFLSFCRMPLRAPKRLKLHTPVIFGGSLKLVISVDEAKDPNESNPKSLGRAVEQKGKEDHQAQHSKGHAVEKSVLPNGKKRDKKGDDTG